MKISARHIRTTLLLAVALGGPWAALQGQMASDLEGGWVITGWQAGDGQTGPTPQRGLFLFTASGQYSMMFVIGESREALGANPSDADIAAAYGPFVANSGRYSVSGAEITYEAFMAKDPAYMAGFEPTGGAGNAQTITYTIGDDGLTLHFGDGGPMAGATATLRHLGGAE